MQTASSLTASLNEAQLAAVTAPPSHLLVLAGAGSGKTRVLVHRMAWLIEQGLTTPHQLLAVTFTNKAAHEMRGRLEALLGHPMSSLWVGTFHGLAHRLLRLHWQDAGLSEGFQILDTDDQYRLIRRLQKQLNLDESKWPPKQTQWFINKQKESGLRPAQVVNHDHSYFTETLTRLYHAYDELCRRSSLVDFAELLLRSLELLKNHAHIRSHYQQRFQYLLIDEFQDTNPLQYAWIQLFRSPHNYFTAVGDDDQSIYSWRGACVDNLHHFLEDFKPVTTVRLEQNYRSTQTILSAANAVIAHNTQRMGKALWTEGNTGEPISVYPAFNDRDESYYIANIIRQWLRAGQDPRDIAVLYRSNAQSRVLEEQLIQHQVPYRVYGGLRFYERAEIKDAIAYLRLLNNRHDDASFERIINTPTRGIGPNTLTLLRETSRQRQISLWDALQAVISEQALPARACNALQAFSHLITTLSADRPQLSLGQLFEHVLQRSGLREFHHKEHDEKGLSRIENLDELVNAASQFNPEHVEADPLNDFLAHIALESGEDQSQSLDAVGLMTLHAAKGLEFPFVIICGLEEELFPHKMSMEDEQGLEEERRLCYVGITRAMRKLVLTYAESRRWYGVDKLCMPSRFLQEIPESLIVTERTPSKVSRPQAYAAADDDINDLALYVGQRVSHPTFGPGTILGYEGQGQHTRLQIKFDRAGTKWLVASFARLEAL